MKKYLIPFAALLLMTGTGMGGFMVASKPALASEEKAAEEGAPQITFIPMEPIILPIIGREGITQTISIVISLQVGNPVKAEEVKHNLPRLADAYLSDMYGTLSQKAAMEGGVIKVSALKTRLKNVTEKLMPDGGIDDVLLQVLQQHPT